jgi:hypothetical protein
MAWASRKRPISDINAIILCIRGSTAEVLYYRSADPRSSPVRDSNYGQQYLGGHACVSHVQGTRLGDVLKCKQTYTPAHSSNSKANLGHLSMSQDL